MNASPLAGVLLLVASAFAAENATNASMMKLNVTVYYESLCPDSMAFVTKQLYPVWEKNMDKIDLNLVPYGKATMEKNDTAFSFKCHHGEEECVGNKIQSCILEGSAVPKPDDRVKLINCLMKEAKSGTAYPTKMCVTNLATLDVTATTEALEKCANSSRGDELLKTNGEKTQAFESAGLTNVPTVTINGMKDAAAVADFQTAFCSQFTTNKPEMCPKSKNGASAVAAVTLLPLAAALAMISL